MYVSIFIICFINSQQNLNEMQQIKIVSKDRLEYISTISSINICNSFIGIIYMCMVMIDIFHFGSI